MPGDNVQLCYSGTASERRQTDRRRHVFHALVVGSFRRRRHGPRRAGESTLSAVDWHHPQWLAIAIFIVAFSAGDALLTLALIDQGAAEVNPFMAPLVAGSPLAFAMVKVGVTSGGVIVLTQLAGIRAFGRIPVGVLLYSTLAVYGAVLLYEMHLLHAA